MLFQMHASAVVHVQASALQERSHREIHSMRSTLIAVLIADPARLFARQALSHRVDVIDKRSLRRVVYSARFFE